MGRNGPNLWRRWHKLGDQVLLFCRHGPSSQLGKDALVVSYVREKSLNVVSAESVAATAAIWGRTGCTSSTSFHSLASKGTIYTGLISSQGYSSFSQLSQHGCGVKFLSTAAHGLSKNARSSTGIGRQWGGQNRIMEAENVGASVVIQDGSIVRSGLHRCGFSMVQRCEFSRIMCAEAEHTEIEIVDPEPEYTIFPSHNLALPTKSPRRTGISIANALLDSGNGTSRASKLPLHSALPSLRNHRVGENPFLGMQGAEATAYMPAGDTVDWQQQRLGKWKDYDPRPKRPHSSPHSEAEPDDIFIPVKAFYISRSVDLKSLAREPFLEVTSSRNNLIIRCADRPPHSPVTADNPEMACLGFLKERYMVTFQYGSVVFFNFGDLEEVESLDIVRKYCSDEFREARKDDYGVLVRPTLQEWSEGGHDRVMLRKLDIDNIRVISSILGQSIALDHYAKKVDEMVTTFSELNRGMEQTGTFTMTRKSLFQLVAAANTTLADVILRLGLLERSDAAWKDANYAQIWEYLRDDFELDERFESLDFKLNIIQHNVRFFLEILQNRKSDTLEWIIILLITGEICVSLYDILHTAGAI